jgi:hypothetical protein
MSQELTQVEFYFVAPDGNPVKNTSISIQLASGGFDKDVPGVIMPREIIRVTDDQGKVTVSLQPSETVYYVTVEDSESQAALSYKFYVPAVDNADDVVRLQDIIVDAEMGPISYDEAALLAIHSVKAVVLMHRTAAEVAANASNTAKIGAQDARDMALRAMVVTSPTPPLNPLPNQEWIETTTLNRYTWMIDTMSGIGVWAEIGPVLVVEVGTGTGGDELGKLIYDDALGNSAFVVTNGDKGRRVRVEDAVIQLNEIPLAQSVSGTDTIVINQGGVDRQVSLSVLAAFFNAI